MKIKSLLIWGIVGITLSSMVITGFQCSSAEVTSAKLYITRKEFQSAEAALMKETQKNAKNEEAWLLLGKVRLELKNYKGMKDAFVEVLKIAPTHKKEIDAITISIWGGLFNKGVDYINKAVDTLEYYDNAIDAFTMAMYVIPDSLINQRNLGLAYYRKSDALRAKMRPQEAEEALQMSVEPLTISFEKAKDVMACRLVSEIYSVKASDLKSKFMEVNHDAFAAVKNIESIHEKMKAIDVKLYLGQPTTVNKPEPPKGKKKSDKEEWIYSQYNLTVSVENDLVVSVTSNYKANIDSTLFHEAVAQYNKAIEILKKGQAAFPEDPLISENLMNSYIGAERNAEAHTLLEERVKKYPESKFDHYNLGVFQLKDLKYENAVEQFHAALKIDSAFSAARYNLAATYVNWGVAEQERIKKSGKEDDVSYKEKYKSAVPYLEQVIASKPDDIQMLELLGQVYANLGQADKATEMYKKADDIRSGKK